MWVIVFSVKSCERLVDAPALLVELAGELVGLEQPPLGEHLAVRR